MKRYISLIILLFIAIAVWAWNGFPQDIVAASAAILAVFSGISLFLGTAKMMDERFSKKDAVSPLKELFNSSQPLIFQIAHPLPLPVEKSETLKKVRSFSDPRKQAEGILRTLLGKKYAQFWQQVDADEILASLVRDAFWLEGLVLVFEQNKYSFPKNIGKTLAQVMLNQWTDEKLNIKKIISLESFQLHLGKLAQRNYPHTHLPAHYEGHVSDQPYDDYEWLLMDLGKPPYPQTSPLVKYLWLPLFKLVIKDPQSFSEKLEKLRSPWKEIILLPLYMLFSPVEFLKNLLLFPFVWVERNLERFANDYEKDGPFWRVFSRFWHDKYRVFKKHAKRFIDRFNIDRNRSLRRAELILQCAKKAGILDSDGKHIWFTKEYWRDYLTAQTLGSEDSLDYFLRKHSFRRQSSFDYGEESVVLMACGLRADPEKAVEQILAYNALVASKCAIALDDISQDVEEVLRNKILKKLVHDIETVEHDGNSWFCIRSIRAMRSLSDNPFYAHVALEKMPGIYDHTFHPQAAKLVASFGSPVFKMAMEKAKSDDPHIVRMMLIALGELKDQRALPYLRGLLENRDVRVRTMSAVVLAACFKDEAGILMLEKLLRFDYPEKKEYIPWFDLALVGENAIAFGLDLMVRSSVSPSDRQMDEMWFGMKEQFLKVLERSYQDNPKVEAMLLDCLEHSEQIRLTHFVIEALGRVKSRKAIPELTKFLVHGDDYASQLALGALKQLGDVMICSEVTGLLYSSNLHLVKEAISVLSAMKCLDAIPALIEKLESDEIEKYYEKDEGYPIALYAAEGLMTLGIGIKEMKALTQVQKDAAEVCLNAAADWFGAHLGDKRELRNPYRTLAYQSLRNLYLLSGSITKAKDYYYKWIEEHPEDRI